MNFGMLGNQAAAYLATPEGQETVKKFFSSAEGTSFLTQYLSSPEGAGVAKAVLPAVLQNLNLPAGAQEMVLKMLQGQ